MNDAPRHWWPYDLSDDEERARQQYRRLLERRSPIRDSRAATRAEAALRRLVWAHRAEVLESDHLPTLAHIINGWGNLTVAGRSVLDGVARFLHRDKQGRLFVPQCDPEGDIHPWQTFAYAAMAGVDFAEPLPGSVTTLRDVARASTHLNTQEGEQLGHLLFTLARVEGWDAASFFDLDGVEYGFAELASAAAVAHHEGHFDVCRKCHLTEGICEIAALRQVPAEFRALAAAFLIGQMETLVLLGTLLWSIPRAGSSGVVSGIRSALQIGDVAENHYYYAGHLVEMLCFAHLQGYELDKVYWRAAVDVLNRLDELLLAIEPDVVFCENCYQFAHYRRGATMLEQCLGGSREVDLRRYWTVLGHAPEPPPPQPSTGLADAFAVATRQRLPETAHFAAELRAYATLAPAGLEARGCFGHFRRIGPRLWPRAFHYELLDYGDHIGAEIHAEGTQMHELLQASRDLLPEVEAAFPRQQVDWEPRWARGNGRLRVLFGGDAGPGAVAIGMHRLIQLSFASLDPLASTSVHRRTSSSKVPR